jgi:plasmid maintenance system antidote protein VapI
MKKKTALKIAKELSELFPDEDFSSNGYVGATEKIAFTCKIHGVQQGLVDNIKKRTGTACTSCIRHQNKASKLQEAVSKLKTRFSDMDFSRFNPALLNAKSTVVCPVHNEFQVSPDSMAANKYGCSKCGDAKTAEGKRLGFESFQIRALKAHSGMYTYKKADYIDTTTPMTIHCPAHKEFMQKPTNHLAGQGCPECGRVRAPKSRCNATDTKIHSEGFKSVGDMMLTMYTQGKLTTTVIAHKTGVDTKTVNRRIRKAGGAIISTPHSVISELTKEQVAFANAMYFKKFKSIYDVADYLKSSPSTAKNLFLSQGFKLRTGSAARMKGKQKPGKFLVWALFVEKALPAKHLAEKLGVSAPYIKDILKSLGFDHKRNAGITSSFMEREVVTFVRSLTDLQVVSNYRGIKDCTEVDIYVPAKSLAIEFNGLFYHGHHEFKSANLRIPGKPKTYHLQKTLACQAAGAKLLHLWEDEWSEKQDIVKSCIRNQLGVTSRTVYARKTLIKQVEKPVAREFFKVNHLLGKCSSHVVYGLYSDDELISAMAFKNGPSNQEEDWNLIRFCCKLNTRVVGGASKLLKGFRSEFEGSIVSFAERRWSDGGLYEKLGFELTKLTPPDYKYTDCKNRYHKFGFRHSGMKKKLNVYDPGKSEAENMMVNGYNKIYDCGLARYYLKK